MRTTRLRSAVNGTRSAITAGIDLSQSQSSRLVFGQAQVAASRARRLASSAPVSPGPVGQDGERDWVIQAVALTSDAVHDWVTWALVATRVPFPITRARLGEAVLERWGKVPLIARALGRRHDFSLRRDHEAILRHLMDWHAALSYADPAAQRRVRDRLVVQGKIDRRQSESHAVTAEIAAEVVTGARELFQWAATVTGLPTPTDPWTNP